MDDIRVTEASIGRSLILFWALPSIVAGAVGLIINTAVPLPVLRGIAIHALAWGGVDAGIGLYAVLRARRDASNYPDEYHDEARRRRLRRILRINANLDVAYIVAGIAVAVAFRDTPFLLGNGVGVGIQGLALLVFDTIHAARLPKNAPPWYDPAL